MATRKSLEDFIDLISKIASQNGNTWFVDKLVRKISDLDAQPITRQTLNEIHMHCIEDVILTQAKGFYANFRLEKIRPSLISLYGQMERHRRNDEFEEFCESLFEQLELISRTLFTDKEKEIVYENHEQGLLCGKKLWQIIFYDTCEFYKKVFNEVPSKWGIEYQICAIIYTRYYNAPRPMQLNCDQFLFFKKIISNLALIRNINSHPGSSFTEPQQSIATSIANDKHRNYIKYLGFLEDFTRTINKNIN